MTSFLQTAQGGIQPINGRAGSLVENLKQANQGTPGRDIIVNVANQIITATQIRVPSNACDPQAALQQAQQRAQQQIQQILENHILKEVQRDISTSPVVLDAQKQLQSLVAQQKVTESTTQQVEILEKEIEKEVNAAIIGVIGRTATQLPQVTKIANSSAAGLKTVATVAESLAAFVPSQGINMSAYGAGQKTIQTVSQACSI